MTYFSAIPTAETTLGVALETERGVPVEPNFWIPVESPKYKPNVQYLPDAGMRGSMVTLYDEVPGLRFDEHSFDAFPYLDTLPVFLRALLGSKDTLTAVVPLTTLVLEAKIADKVIVTVIELAEGITIILDEGTAAEEVTVTGKSTKVKAGEWSTVVPTLSKKHEIAATVTGPTELLKEAKAGALTFVLAYDVKAGSYLTLGVGAGTEETVLVTKTKEVKAGEWTITVAYPLSFTHPAKAFVDGLTSHAFSLLNNEPTEGNQPVSLTLTDYAGEEKWRQLAAAQLDSLSISGAGDSLPKVAYNFFTNGSVPPVGSPSASFSTAEAPPGWTVKCAINGTQVSYLVNWSFDLKRNVKNIPAITGNQNYYQHFAGPLAATGKLTVLEDQEATWLSAYQEGTPISIDLTLSDVETGYAVNFHTSRSKFITGEVDRSKEYVEVPLEFQPIPTTEDALAGGVSPIAITVANASPTAF